MNRIVTLAERMAAAATRGPGFAAGAGKLRPCSWRWSLPFGSAARKQMGYDSDVDILAAFPPDRRAVAWNFAERACWDRQLDPDVMASAWCRDEYLASVHSDAEMLGGQVIDAD
jgi:hypothetical protein